MDYQTFLPHADLGSFVKCFWTLKVPLQENPKRQLILPDGCIEMIFILGDDVKRYTNEEDFVLQPRELILGQITEPLYIEPTGHVNTFAVRFYPYGFANFVDVPIKNLANKDTPIASLFGDKEAAALTDEIHQAPQSEDKIEVINHFLRGRLRTKETIDKIVKSTIDLMYSSKGRASIKTLIENDGSKRRQLERKFSTQIGISPKELSKVIRLQAVLGMLLNDSPENLTEIAYESQYYDQAHFIKDFKQYTGVTPKAFLGEDSMELSSRFYGEK